MSLSIHLEKKIGGVTFKSGHVYSFRYQGWQHDPEPTLIFMYAFSGKHPRTQREWRFIQGINLTYVPRPLRKAFAITWIREFERTNGNAEFTWDLVKNRFPYLGLAVRRYFYSPSYYITSTRHIPFQEMEEVIVSTWSKDFSKKVKTQLTRQFKKAVAGPPNKKKMGFFGRLFKK
jgi:hypothetical protein